MLSYTSQSSDLSQRRSLQKICQHRLKYNLTHSLLRFLLSLPQTTPSRKQTSQWTSRSNPSHQQTPRLRPLFTTTSSTPGHRPSSTCMTMGRCPLRGTRASLGEAASNRSPRSPPSDSNTRDGITHQMPYRRRIRRCRGPGRGC